MTSQTKIAEGKAFFAKVEADIGPINDHIIDLFFDNAGKLGFSDDECLEIGNIIRVSKSLAPVAKWWT